MRPGTREPTNERRFEAIPQRAQADAFDRQFERSELESACEADDARDIFRSGAQARFLTAADDERSQRRPGSHVERPDTLGPVQLVRREREKIDTELLYVQRRVLPGA